MSSVIATPCTPRTQKVTFAAQVARRPATPTAQRAFALTLGPRPRNPRINTLSKLVLTPPTPPRKSTAATAPLSFTRTPVKKVALSRRAHVAKSPKLSKRRAALRSKHFGDGARESQVLGRLPFRAVPFRLEKVASEDDAFWVPRV
ncbi:hypothetical protein K474DRAFT_170066 [Panus rudis PR-1116 ss-1]|nr:hypothetical protein K474DRAFT_170066 [Panus rudis PR-1116 ss-1]